MGNDKDKDKVGKIRKGGKKVGTSLFQIIITHKFKATYLFNSQNRV